MKTHVAIQRSLTMADVRVGVRFAYIPVQVVRCSCRNNERLAEGQQKDSDNQSKSSWAGVRTHSSKAHLALLEDAKSCVEVVCIPL